MSIIIFILYLLLFAWLVTRIKFFKHSGLGQPQLISLFLLKVFAGVAYGLFYAQPHYLATSDTWNFYNESIKETQVLLHQPLAFIKDIFSYGYAESGNLFAGQNSYWNDLKSNVIIKLMAVLNVFTYNNYYSNIIFLNFIFFFGPVAFYRTAKALYNVNKILLILAIFLLPSFLFWCSGAHKDGLIFSALSLIIYAFHKQLNRPLQPKYIINIILCFAMLFALRNFVAILLLPALLVWFCTHKYPRKSAFIISATYLLGLLIFFIAPYINNVFNFPQYIVTKQQEFKQLPGNSGIDVPQLEPSFKSFVKFAPSAFDVAFFRPHITEIKNKSYVPAAIEVILLNILAFIAIILSKKHADHHQKSFTIFCFCFAISFLLLCGYTITFSGAIVRYRSIVLPLLFAPLMQFIPWPANKKQ